MHLHIFIIWKVMESIKCIFTLINLKHFANIHRIQLRTKIVCFNFSMRSMKSYNVNVNMNVRIEEWTKFQWSAFKRFWMITMLMWESTATSCVCVFVIVYENMCVPVHEYNYTLKLYVYTNSQTTTHLTVNNSCVSCACLRLIWMNTREAKKRITHSQKEWRPNTLENNNKVHWRFTSLHISICSVCVYSPEWFMICPYFFFSLSFGPK